MQRTDDEIGIKTLIFDEKSIRLSIRVSDEILSFSLIEKIALRVVWPIRFFIGGCPSFADPDFRWSVYAEYV